jgi:hypothetical protein
MVVRVWIKEEYSTSRSRGDDCTPQIWDVPVRASRTPQARIAPCRVAHMGEVKSAPIKKGGFSWL